MDTSVSIPNYVERVKTAYVLCEDREPSPEEWWKDNTIRYAERERERAIEESTSQASGSLEERFNELAQKWREETRGYSLTAQKYAHPAYQSILVLGPDVVPLILNELQVRPGRWLQALKALNNGFDPSQQGDDFDEAVKAWINWGRATKLIP
ncbi:MAG TPA: hypothetical protein VFC44_02220 [Candidatus Saccharimonadales bacterium]|nr:hypothetical protein [Candidatus Saccharimonadales bacterium]